eukprot:IDg2447t1
MSEIIDFTFTNSAPEADSDATRSESSATAYDSDFVLVDDEKITISEGNTTEK